MRIDTTGLVDDPREPCTGARLTTTCVARRHVDASCNIFILVSLNEQHGGRGCALTDFVCVFSFPWLADHERDWPPYETFFRVGNYYGSCEKQHSNLAILKSGYFLLCC